MIFIDIERGYTNAPFPEDFEKEQIDEILNQAIKRSERYIKLKNRNTRVKN